MNKWILLLFCVFGSLYANAQIIYVTPNGTGNGTSWANASGQLATVMNTAGPNAEIWVAQGTYFPTTCTSCTTTNREVYFQLKEGVEVYGGFVGNETQRNQRNWQSNLTTLSGDINQDGTLSNNSFSVLYSRNVSAASVLDGFVIKGGNANGINGDAESPYLSGAGWYNLVTPGNSSNPTVRNCTFQDNDAMRFGGGFFNDGSNGTANPIFVNCIFKNNDANEGGGMYNLSASGVASPKLTDCLIQNNTSLYGAGIFNNANGGTSSPTLVNCRLDHNVTSFYGGGMYSFVKTGSSHCNPVLVNCVVSNNSASSAGGIYSLAASAGTFSATLTNCVFYGNYANVGGAYYVNASSDASGTSTFANCIFGGSTAGYDRIFHFSGTGNPVNNLSYCLADVANCNALSGAINGTVNCGAGMQYNQNPQFVNAPANDFHLTANSPAKDMGNNVDINATGINVDFDNQPRIVGGTVDMGPFEFTTGDSDGDGFPDNVDNCPNTPNADQLNDDGDPAGNVCDCDPNNPNVYPGAPEICDGLDNNCNGQIDEDGPNVYYADTDGDTFGDPNNTINGCSPPTGYVTNNLDCDDTDALVYPGAMEICDGVDNNCDGQIDENVSDNVPPVVVCQNMSIALNNNGVATIIPADVYASGSDNCGSINLLSVLPNSFSSANLGANTVILTVDDGHGNSASCDAVVTVLPYQGGPANYCNASGNQPWVEWIENVTFGSIDNNSSKEQYGDFTNLNTLVDQGATYAISLKPRFSWPHFNEYFRVWIDYNGDGDFTDANEVVFSAITPIGASGSNPPAVTGTVVIPANANPGTTRMRVAMQRDAYAPPCGSFDFGEVEDYTVVINAGGPILSLQCPPNVMLIAAPGATDAMATWSLPTTSTTCTGTVLLNQTAGLSSGSLFPIGTTTISYEATDDCNNVVNCSFEVIVENFMTSLTLECPANISQSLSSGSSSIAVSWSDPIWNSNCPTGQVTLTQTAGPVSGSLFMAGITSIAYSATDDCGNSASCNFTITVNDPNQGEVPIYCNSLGQQPWQEWIGNVTFGSINNSSLKSMYSDFTDQSTLVSAGSSYSISIQPSFSWTQWDEYISVWIDYNQDGDFEDTGELAFSGISPAGPPPTAVPPLLGNISIPTNATNGITGMRVSMNREAYATPCESFMFGEVEDYAVVISGGATTFSDPDGDIVYLMKTIVNPSNPSSSRLDFKLFPNPARDELTIDLAQYTGRSVQLFIYNQLGQLQWQRRIDSDSHQQEVFLEQLDVSDFSDGWYTVIVRSENGSSAKKLVIAR